MRGDDSPRNGASERAKETSADEHRQCQGGLGSHVIEPDEVFNAIVDEAWFVEDKNERKLASVEPDSPVFVSIKPLVPSSDFDEHNSLTCNASVGETDIERSTRRTH